MITIKLLNRVADAGGNFPAGSELTLEPGNAQELIQGGYAIPVIEQQIEQAVIPSQTVETRTEEKPTNDKPKRRRSKKT